MVLKKISEKSIYNIVEKSISHNSLFTDYILEDYKIRKLKSPTLVKQYNFYLKSTKFNRKVQIRINDYHKNQNLEIWIDKMDDSNLNRFNVKYHFLNLKINTIKQKLKFKCSSENDLYRSVDGILNFINENADIKLIKIFKGEDWVDMPFDWGEYK